MKIVSIALSRHKGTRKEVVEEARLVKAHGLEGDAHAGDWHRQVLEPYFMVFDLSSKIIPINPLPYYLIFS